MPSLGVRDVLVKILAAPINPSDINMIQGKLLPQHGAHINLLQCLFVFSLIVGYEDDAVAQWLALPPHS